MVSGFEQALLVALVFLLMLGMGATITLAHAREVWEQPRGVLIGLGSQFGWMPALAFLLAKIFALSPEQSLGLVIIGCSPGGATSNLFTYLVRGDVALSVAMTAASTLVAVLLMPLCLWLYTRGLTGAELQVPYGNFASNLLLMLIPVGIGVWVRARSEAKARFLESIGSGSGIAVLLLLIVTGLVRNGAELLVIPWAMYAAGIGLGLCGFACGYLGARLWKMSAAQCRSVAFETGIQNSPLAIALIVASFAEPQQSEILKMPLLYALFVLVSATAVTLLWRLGTRPR